MERALPSQLFGLRLVRNGLISTAQLEEALEYQLSHPEMGLLQALDALDIVEEDISTRAIAADVGIPFIAEDDLDIAQYMQEIIPRDIAIKYHVAPYRDLGDGLTFLMANPTDVIMVDDLRRITGKNIHTIMTTESAIERAISLIYTDVSYGLDLDLFDDPTALSPAEIQTTALAELNEVVDDSPTVKLVNYIIQKAVADGASDIHVEPQEHDLRIRFRIDGVLQEIMRSPKSGQSAIISRIKIMADIDISETRKPQDGHCSFTVGSKKIDFRVSSLPTAHGERIVMRILRTDSVLLRLEDLGFSANNLKIFERSFKKPYGAILVTGPTGSGKSTSLYAAINILNSPEKHILTAEDPVEYRLPGINQVQINPKAGLLFSTALRSFLRCSPDIILVGEIRDRETAQIATEAALTGHLVLSTLHTNDAASAITRLTEMGIEPFLISSSLDCIVAQRLARKLCPDCKEAYTPEPEALDRLNFASGERPTVLYRAKGCRKCNDSGFKGRIGIHEILIVTEEIGRLTVAGATGDEIKQAAIAQGMLTLHQDGLSKAAAGITSVEEVLRVAM